MNPSWSVLLAYGLTGVAYGAVALVVYLSQPLTRRASLVVVAIVASCLWASGIAVLSVSEPNAPLAAWIGLDSVHIFAWTVCVLSWLVSARRWLWGALSLALGSWATLASLPVFSPTPIGATVYAAMIIMAALVLLIVEQVYRNAREEQRRCLGPLCSAIGGIAVFDVFLYSQAAILGRPVSLFWLARGVANAAFLALIVRGIRRHAEWRRELFVSRQVLFYTTTLLGVGSYLLLTGVVAYLIRATGSQWSYWLEMIFLAGAGAVLVCVLFSTTIRVRLRAFLVKHFYRNKYDYRQEWLRLTQSLGHAGDTQELARKCLEALARIVGSNRGDLWLARSSGHYDWAASLGESQLMPVPGYSADHPVVAFLAKRSWVIDSEEYAVAPDRYDTAFGSPDEGVLPENSILVPLDCQGFLQGFVRLSKPAGTGSLNFEDHDILKTAGKQVAVALAQSLAQEKLAETRQFEAMNKMSTFLMHDLKNVIAQQQLIVSNAARFRHRAEFFDDAISTLRLGIERMQHVLSQLSGAAGGVGRERADVSKVLMEVRSHCADRQPIPTISCSGRPLWVAMERAKLTSILTHLVRNAQDATPEDGIIRLEAMVNGSEVVCTVSDTGCGMDPGFVRDRLFRPFDSTKGDQGMGIGAYQVREMVRATGGDVEVISARNAGTVFRVRLPLADGTESMLAAV